MTLLGTTGLALLLCLLLTGRGLAQDYALGPDSQPQDVPHGTVTKHEIVSEKAYPGVHHDYWLYVPAQYDGKTPAAVMVFQDGGGFADAKGDFRVPVVFDNLIAKKDLPVTIAIMINPGNLPAVDPKTQSPRIQRSFQYDAPTDLYARFLIDEVLPEVGKTYKLTDDPNLRAICGNSSGGICAFTVAWERPDAFRRVLSHVGSFTDLRGGNRYPDLIRKTEPLPLRVFLQTGAQDMNVFGGSWYVANQDMAAALKWAGYDYKFVEGAGGHSGKHGGSIFPDSLRWLWREWSKPLAATTHVPGNSVMDIVVPGEGWEVASSGHKIAEGITADADGNIYFADTPNSRIHKIDLAGKVSVVAENTQHAVGVRIGPDGRLYACQAQAGRVVAYDLRTGKEAVIAEGIDRCQDLAINADGGMYVTGWALRRLWYVSPAREKKVVEVDIGGVPGGVSFTPDQGQVFVSAVTGVNVHAFQVQADGTLTYEQPFFTLQTPAQEFASGANGLCVDAAGRLYVATRLGLQICDQHGRGMAIIRKPQNAWMSGVTFGGKNLDTLYVTCGDKVYRRKTQTKGVHSFLPPVKAPPDKLG